MSPFFLAPSCTSLRHSTSLISTSHRLRPHPRTQRRCYIIRAPSLSIPSVRNQDSLLAPSRLSSPRSSLRHGLPSLCWYVWYLSLPHLVRPQCVADNGLFVLIVGCSAPRHSSPLLTKHSLFRTLPFPYRGPLILVLG
jgi:hypothetical protein